MLHLRLIAPEVGAADVTEGEPNPRVHRVVIGRILPFDRRVIPRGLHAVRRMHGGPVGARDLLVLENICREWLATHGDFQPVLFLLDGDVPRRIPFGTPRRGAQHGGHEDQLT